MKKMEESPETKSDVVNKISFELCHILEERLNEVRHETKWNKETVLSIGSKIAYTFFSNIMSTLIVNILIDNPNEDFDHVLEVIYHHSFAELNELKSQLKEKVIKCIPEIREKMALEKEMIH